MSTSMDKPLRIAIVGAGPSGLVTLKFLKAASDYFPIRPIEVRVFEAEAKVGGTFAYRGYEDGEMVSSRHLTTFSDFRIPSQPDFLSIPDYCTYLESYCSYFKLWDHISLNTRVTNLRRRREGGHVVTYESNSSGILSEWACDAVAICSGLHVTPAIPPLEGIERVPTVMHSSQFKERKQFGEDKNVLILGSGETGMDIAYLAVTAPTKSVTLSHKDGFFSAPKKFPNPISRGKVSSKGDLPPTDTSGPALFDTAYVHHSLRNHPWLLWEYYDKWMKFSFWLIGGTTRGLDQWAAGPSDHVFHASKFFVNKSSRAIPYISKQYRPNDESYWKRARIINIPIAPTNGRIIDVAPWPSHIDASGIVHFKDNGRPEVERMKQVELKPDVIVFATGYRQEFPFLNKEDNYPMPQQADMRRIWSSSDPTVGYIGFLRPGFGAIPPISEMQAQLWTLAVISHLTPLNLVKNLKFEDSYKMLVNEDYRIDYGVDHESYIYQLALDMGTAPGALQMAMQGWKLFASWALSVNINPKFRLVGPWKWDGAKDVMEGEIWDAIKRRSPYSHITLTMVPWTVFGLLNLSLAIVWAPYDIVTGLWSMIRG